MRGGYWLYRGAHAAASRLDAQGLEIDNTSCFLCCVSRHTRYSIPMNNANSRRIESLVASLNGSQESWNAGVLDLYFQHQLSKKKIAELIAGSGQETSYEAALYDVSNLLESQM